MKTGGIENDEVPLPFRVRKGQTVKNQENIGRIYVCLVSRVD